MKRFHVHVSVRDLPGNIEFYSRLFGQAPARQERDYAKWMLDDPRINFAISSRSGAQGVDHFGFQVDNETELAHLKDNARDAGEEILDEGQTQCCYAHSEKHWTVDPQGLPWEHFVTMGEAVRFGTGRKGSADDTTTQATTTESAHVPNNCCGG